MLFSFFSRFGSSKIVSEDILSQDQDNSTAIFDDLPIMAFIWEKKFYGIYKNSKGPVSNG
ncbi:MAG: hypothetical protein B7Y30_06540 [Campylobacterales bacterium 16-40-21]|nr:MAG: hypothetical protein B7Y30_06540 [Campylobacterales bacterium 16-40-21]